MATQRQIEANRKNGRKGGPKTAKGKAVSRFNARKHGVFSAAITKYDQKELAGIYDELADHFQPAGPVETMLVESIALTYLRLHRCARAEAEYHIKTWDERPGTYQEDDYLDRKVSGRHATWFQPAKFEKTVELFGRYNTSLTNQLVKLMHELERLQRMRLGESAPPPVAADVTVTGEVETVSGDSPKVLGGEE